MSCITYTPINYNILGYKNTTMLGIILLITHYSLFCLLFLQNWSRLSDLNRGPSLYKSVALPTELRRQIVFYRDYFIPSSSFIKCLIFLIFWRYSEITFRYFETSFSSSVLMNIYGWKSWSETND